MRTRIKWVGAKNIQLQPGYPKFFSQSDSEGYRLCYRGPYITLMANRPQLGSPMKMFPGYFVEDISIEPDGAGSTGPGTMLLTIASGRAGGDASISDETILEVESGILEKELLQHPKFANVSAADAKRVRDLVDRGQALPNPDARADITALYNLLRKGVQTYVVSAPSLRITTSQFTRPTIGNIGIGTRTTEKPHPLAPDGWVWLKMADRIGRHGRKGKWERVEMWQGADEWSEFLYGPDTP